MRTFNNRHRGYNKNSGRMKMCGLSQYQGNIMYPVALNNTGKWSNMETIKEVDEVVNVEKASQQPRPKELRMLEEKGNPSEGKNRLNEDEKNAPEIQQDIIDNNYDVKETTLD